MKLPQHGANPDYVYKAMAIKQPEDLLDFSMNVNPAGPPASILECWTDWLPAVNDYPDPEGRELIEDISLQEGLSTSQIMLGNGAAELIQLLASSLQGKRVLLIQPTFSEYERMCRAFDCEITHFVLEGVNEWQLELSDLEPLLATHDAIFFCHPNNPTGVISSEQSLVALLSACSQHNCLLIVDEAFYDFMDRPFTMASQLPGQDHLVVLRSLTKMYAIAGLRLGYLLASPRMIQHLKKRQSHWSVNAIALLSGLQCLRATDFAAQTRMECTIERNRMLEKLTSYGYRISKSHVNYYLLQDPQLDDQYPLYVHLLKQGIVPRHTYNYKGLAGRWLRFAIRDTTDNDILLEALQRWKQEN